MSDQVRMTIKGKTLNFSIVKPEAACRRARGRHERERGAGGVSGDSRWPALPATRGRSRMFSPRILTVSYAGNVANVTTIFGGTATALCAIGMNPEASEWMLSMNVMIKRIVIECSANVSFIYVTEKP
jgi:hypothetical protein